MDALPNFPGDAAIDNDNTTTAIKEEPLTKDEFDYCGVTSKDRSKHKVKLSSIDVKEEDNAMNTKTYDKEKLEKTIKTDDEQNSTESKHSFPSIIDNKRSESKEINNKIKILDSHSKDGRKLFGCAECEFSSTKIREIKVHLHVHEPDRPYECEICKKKFGKLSVMKRHKLIHLGLRNYLCDFCGKSFPHPMSLKYHKFNHIKDKINKEEKKESENEEERKMFLCDLCGKSFLRAITLKAHKKRHALLESQSNEGNTDILNFKKRKSTIRNRSDVVTSKPKVLNCVKNSYNQIERFEKEMIKKEKKSTGVFDVRVKKKHICDICSYSTATSRDLRVHLRKHSGEKPYSCPICLRAFSKQSAVKRHQTVHTGARPYFCEICNKSFSQASNLKSHKISHFDENTGMPIEKKGRKKSVVIKKKQNEIKLKIDSNDLYSLRDDDFKLDKNRIPDTIEQNICERKLNVSKNPEKYSKHGEICVEQLKNIPEDTYKRDKLNEDAVINKICDINLDIGELKIEKNIVRDDVNVKNEECSSDDEFLIKFKVETVFKEECLENNDFDTCYSDHDNDFVNDYLKDDRTNIENLLPDSQINKLNVEKDVSPLLVKRKKRKKKKVKIKGEKTQDLYNCPQCHYTVSKKRDFEVHLRTHSGEKLYECGICKKRFSKQNVVKRHQLLHTGLKPFKCQICSQSFTQSNALKAHMIKHLGSKPNLPYVCEVCGSSFAQETGLKKHRHVHLRDKKTTAYSCHICGKVFSYECRLKEHLIVHSGEKNYTCEFCNKKFLRIRDMKYHRFLHTKEKMCCCDVCGKSFLTPKMLRLHKLMHSDSRPYVCHICGAAFGRPGHLHRHKKAHSGLRSHSCSTCGKCFTQASSLKRHEMIHSGEKPHQCGICGKAFQVLALLRRHMNNAKHSNVKEDSVDRVQDSKLSKDRT